MKAKKTEWRGGRKNDIEELEKYRVYRVQDTTSMTIKGLRNLRDLKAAVVIAYIYEEGKQTESLVYAPVSFDNTFDQSEFKVLRKFKIWMGVFAVAAALCCCSYAFYKKFDTKQSKSSKD